MLRSIWVIKLTNNFRGISLLPASYKMLSNILLSLLNSHIHEITGANLCGFRSNRSTTEEIFCILQILQKKWECNETVHKLMLYFCILSHAV
jgi:hypothetical protein